MILLGFECTADELAFIEAAKKIPVEPGLEEVVFIDDIALKRKQINYLFHPDAWLNDDVMISTTNLL
jgi:hypothetical protein